MVKVCVFEVDGDAVGSDACLARCGVEAHHDPTVGSYPQTATLHRVRGWST